MGLYSYTLRVVFTKIFGYNSLGSQETRQNGKHLILCLYRFGLVCICIC